MSHLFSAILLDTEAFYEGHILGMAVDAGPDAVLERTMKPRWYAGGSVSTGELRILPIESPGPLWLQANRHFQMREGSLMALGSATRAAVEIDRRGILERFRFFGNDLRSSALSAFQMLLDEVTSEVGAAQGGLTGIDPRFSDREIFISIVMKHVQALSIAIMERNVEAILKRFDMDPASTYLALAGGYALNCPGNSNLMAKYGFRGLIAPPCVNDGGQSLGMALAAFHKKRAGGRFSFLFPGPYLGAEDLDVQQRLLAHEDYVQSTSKLDIGDAVDDLIREPVVWMNGRAEIGPRALGNRSILGDPRVHETKVKLNQLKGRQWWRPVAPVVLEERLNDWFEGARPTPYMLETFTIKEGRRTSIPAVAHLDNSARVQSLSRHQNPLLHDLLTAFESRTGIPLLCNTSLNDKAEPIVNSVDQALNFCLRKRIRVAYINGYRVVLGNFDHYGWSRPLTRDVYPVAKLDTVVLEATRAMLSDNGLTEEDVHAFLWSPDARTVFDLPSAHDAAALDRLVQAIAGCDRASPARSGRYDF